MNAFSLSWRSRASPSIRDFEGGRETPVASTAQLRGDPAQKAATVYGETIPIIRKAGRIEALAFLTRGPGFHL
jgi:hypothetical protein